MGCENGLALPRPSKRLDVGMNNMEPLQEQSRDASVNVASFQQKDEHPCARHHFSPRTHFLQVSSDRSDCFSTDLITPMPLRVIPPGKMPKGIVSPPTTHDAISTETASSTPTGDGRNLQVALCPAEHNRRMEHGIAANIVYSNPPTIEGESANGKRIATVSPSHLEQTSAGDRCDVADPCSSLIFPSRGAKYRSIQDRLRKARISEGIKALRNSVPCSETSDKDDEAAVLDDTIDYIKYLKLQLKLLSQSRLNCESTSYPFVHLEGYGHYLLHPRVCGETLEDTMGNLLEVKPGLANELLESKGLAILPMDLAYALLQTI